MILRSFTFLDFRFWIFDFRSFFVSRETLSHQVALVFVFVIKALFFLPFCFPLSTFPFPPCFSPFLFPCFYINFLGVNDRERKSWRDFRSTETEKCDFRLPHGSATCTSVPDPGAAPRRDEYRVAKILAGLSLHGNRKTWFSVPSQINNREFWSLIWAPFPGAVTVSGAAHRRGRCVDRGQDLKQTRKNR